MCICSNGRTQGRTTYVRDGQTGDGRTVGRARTDGRTDSRRAVGRSSGRTVGRSAIRASLSRRTAQSKTRKRCRTFRSLSLKATKKRMSCQKLKYVGRRFSGGSDSKDSSTRERRSVPSLAVCRQFSQNGRIVKSSRRSQKKGGD